jgi:hypothetical protein
MEWLLFSDALPIFLSIAIAATTWQFIKWLLFLKKKVELNSNCTITLQLHSTIDAFVNILANTPARRFRRRSLCSNAILSNLSTAPA